MGINVKDSGNWRAVQEMHIKDSGTWRKINEAYVKDGGVWRKVFPEFNYQMTMKVHGVYTDYANPSGTSAMKIKYGFAEFDPNLQIPFGKIDNVESAVDGTNSYKIHTCTVGPGNNYTNTGTPGTTGSPGQANEMRYYGGMPTNQSSDSSNNNRPNANFGSISDVNTSFSCNDFSLDNATTGAMSYQTRGVFSVKGFAHNTPVTTSFFRFAPALSGGHCFALHFTASASSGLGFGAPYSYVRLTRNFNNINSVYTGRNHQGAGSGTTAGGKIAFLNSYGTGGYLFGERSTGTPSVGSNVFYYDATNGNVAYPIGLPNVNASTGAFETNSFTLELYQSPLIGFQSWPNASRKAGGHSRVQRFTRLLACVWEDAVNGGASDKLTLIFDDEGWEVTDLFSKITLSNGTNTVEYSMGSLVDFNTASGTNNSTFSANRSSFFSITEYVVSGIPSGSQLYQLFSMNDDVTISITQ